ncbi:TerB family tellurite resistance protein [Defluviimonas sp. WL0002]|uniref:TerB family tellurite resistance protein n=1 Tax=Albidovulum marisflavi TaxID=2984159 RepID=A0ABT2ZAW9_9RHOB|nr:TerB family tellurite resistance protein [Defluviimonas sp. WL0002]MCV2868218.1 TerB family tellurite resistance protein [Defluviimonas sp. WL0002]
MFSKLLSTLMASPTSLPPDDARLALAALLVRIARADGVYALVEAARIDRALVSRYELSPFEAAHLRQEAEALEAEAPDTVRFTRALKDAVPHEDRIALIETLWSIALADGERDAHEDAVIRLAASLLGVTDAESGLARKRMERGT